MYQKPFDFDDFTIALIATYPEMSEALKEIVQGTRIKVIDIYASFERALAEALKLQDKVDVILTRGGTGHLIKTQASIPVISIPITPFDVAVSVSRLPKDVKKVAFINYRRPVYGIHAIEQQYGVEIVQYQFLTKEEDLWTAVKAAKRDGCDYLIGGAVGASYAAEIGLASSEVVSGKEAVFQAVLEASELIGVKREEHKQTRRLRAAFDALQEGICITDENGVISVFNPPLQRIYDVADGKARGQKLQQVAPGTSLSEAFEKRSPQHNVLETRRSVTMNANHIPIYNKDSFIGMVSTYQDITKIQKLEGQIRQKLSRRGLVGKYTFDDIRTTNARMLTQKAIAKLYAASDSAVLIQGESGTGKELFASSIHAASGYSSGPYVTVNCAAIPEQLLESELFGYAPGAFTGALREGKQGLFELALNGTIFLDEIGEMPKSLQSRLLRVLQEKEVMRIGDSRIIPINCRIISATNRNLEELVRKGVFREDLFYRLNPLTIKIPPLRERGDDVVMLFTYFLAEAGVPENSGAMRVLVREWRDYLMKYTWPGNIRELQNFCSRVFLLDSAARERPEVRELLSQILREMPDTAAGMETLHLEPNLPLKEAMEEAEIQYIDRTLERNEGNTSVTAEKLGISRTTLWRRRGAGR